MTGVVQAPANLPITIVKGADFSLGLTITENSVAYAWSGATVTTSIVVEGTGTAQATNWTFTTGADGVATMSLTDTETTALGVGVFYYYVSVTKSGTTTPWFAGKLDVRAPWTPATSAMTVSLAVSTGGAVTLTITNSSPTAASVPVTDSAGLYTGTNVETVLAELYNTFMPLGVPGTGQYFRAVANQTTAVATLNRLCYTPVEIATPITVDRIGISCTSLVNPSTVRLGIYASAANGYPGALILDAGTVDTSTTGVKEITISQAITARRFWLAAVAQTGTPTTRVATAGKMFGLGFMSTFSSGVGPTTNSALIATNPDSIYEDSVTGTLPATATPGYDASFVNCISVFARQV